MSNPLYDALFAQHQNDPNPFLIDPDGSSITYASFVEGAARLANVLKARGLKPGERLAMQVHKSPQALMVYAACLQSGIVFLPLNTAYTTQEVRYFLCDSGAAMLVCDESKAADLNSVVNDTGAFLETLNADGSGSLFAAAQSQAENFETVPRTETDLAAFLYTSGTTGKSKGAMLSHGNLLSNAQTLESLWEFSKNDRLLHALPIFHTHGLFVATNVTLLAGGAMIFLPKFDIDTVLDCLPKATAMMGVPTFYTRLLQDSRLTRHSTRNMRLFVSGSAPLLPETHRDFKEKTGHTILERYGMTETNMNASNPYRGERRAGTVGHPLPGVELKITDPETGVALGTGEVGQIEVRGPNVFQGYWRLPEKTAAELREDGFFITGDLGLIDEDAYIHIVGRNKDLIISGGYNIYPKEIETVLDAQPGVLESAVIGVPHDDFGETVLALVVADPNESPDLDTICTAAQTTLARFKHPRKILIIDELPRNAMGKVQKNVLRDRYRTLFSTQVAG